MFEDSTFESTGTIRTRSQRWMMATFVFNGSILLALILFPLIYPEALQRPLTSILIEAPRIPDAAPKPPKPLTRSITDRSEIEDGHLVMPTQILSRFRIVADPDATGNASPLSISDMGQGMGQDGTAVNPSLFQTQRQPTVTHQPGAPVRLSSTIAEGMLIKKLLPAYPPIAKVTRTEGTVVLQATISATGTIENLRVVSGHPMLQQAAIEAVKEWRYRPYLLNGQPIEVETTINVVFKLTR
jgi:periplasmic protein TonB